MASLCLSVVPFSSVTKSYLPLPVTESKLPSVLSKCHVRILDATFEPNKARRKPSPGVLRSIQKIKYSLIRKRPNIVLPLESPGGESSIKCRKRSPRAITPSSLRTKLGK
ncbi:hypothetical protein JTE90_019295 [Oedothorax gibbosus]|uniref:Uncharacterized protein n=1 Tax=Oedothorax gibbosus TaxID=931172 RepID=A0AAV6UXM8_9ARAC|nr:hypothetical protein JTE90_019295 [Oedothorax gibbosus]